MSYEPTSDDESLLEEVVAFTAEAANQAEMLATLISAIQDPAYLHALYLANTPGVLLRNELVDAESGLYALQADVIVPVFASHWPATPYGVSVN